MIMRFDEQKHLLLKNWFLIGVGFLIFPLVLFSSCKGGKMEINQTQRSSRSSSSRYRGVGSPKPKGQEPINDLIVDTLPKVKKKPRCCCLGPLLCTLICCAGCASFYPIWYNAGYRSIPSGHCHVDKGFKRYCRSKMDQDPVCRNYSKVLMEDAFYCYVSKKDLLLYNGRYDSIIIDHEKGVYQIEATYKDLKDHVLESKTFKFSSPSNLILDKKRTVRNRKNKKYQKRRGQQGYPKHSQNKKTN